MTLAPVSEFSTPASLMQELKGRTSEGQCGMVQGKETFLYYMWQNRQAMVCKASLVGVNLWDCERWTVENVQGKESVVFALNIAMALEPSERFWPKVNPVEMMQDKGYQGFVTVDGCTLHVFRAIARNGLLPGVV